MPALADRRACVGGCGRLVECRSRQIQNRSRMRSWASSKASWLSFSRGGPRRSRLETDRPTVECDASLEWRAASRIVHRDLAADGPNNADCRAEIVLEFPVCRPPRFEASQIAKPASVAIFPPIAVRGSYCRPRFLPRTIAGGRDCDRPCADHSASGGECSRNHARKGTSSAAGS